jgi:hypothetical protein
VEVITVLITSRTGDSGKLAALNSFAGIVKCRCDRKQEPYDFGTWPFSP